MATNGIVQKNISDTFNKFFASEKSSGILLQFLKVFYYFYRCA